MFLLTFDYARAHCSWYTTDLSLQGWWRAVEVRTLTWPSECTTAASITLLMVTIAVYWRSCTPWIRLRQTLSSRQHAAPSSTRRAVFSSTVIGSAPTSTYASKAVCETNSHNLRICKFVISPFNLMLLHLEYPTSIYSSLPTTHFSHPFSTISFSKKHSFIVFSDGPTCPPSMKLL